MTLSILLHVVAGGVSIVAGFIALFAAKGATLHRRSGTVFVYAMLTMSLSGAGIAAWTGVRASVIPGLVTAYLVFTALTTVRPLPSRWFDAGAMLFGLATALTSIAWGAQGGSFSAGFFIFGTVALLASISDLRVIRSGGLQGIARLTRHLWRMGTALFIATASFFLGQAKVIPEPLRIPPLLALPVLVVIFATLYWLWRVRRRPAARLALAAQHS